MRRAIGPRALTSFALLAVGASALTAQEVDYFGSMQYARGSYIFTETTNSWSLTNGLSLTLDRLRLSASLPVVYQNSGAVSWVGGVPIPTGGEDHGAVANRPSGGRDVPMGRRGSGSGSGTGQGGSLALAASRTALGDTVEAPGDYELSVSDPLFSAGYEVLRANSFYGSMELTGAVKPPLATVESGVGTGEWDYAAGISAALGAGRSVLLFADVAYWWYGDMSELELRNGLGFGAGFGATLSPNVSALLAFSGSQSLIDDVDAPMSLAGSLNIRLMDRARLSLGASAGLTEATPDFTAFVGWSVGLRREPAEPLAAAITYRRGVEP